MGDRYAITGTQNVASPADTCLALEAAATIRARIYDMIFGCHDTPADNAFMWTVQRFTVAGTRTAVVPATLDPGAPAAICQGGENHTVEPTYTAATELLDFGLNQRATFRWVAAPGGEFVLPAVAANGIGVWPFHASSTALVDCTIHFEE